MDAKQFGEIVDATFSRLRELNETKGREYTRGSDNKLANFNRLGDKLGIDPALVLMVYLTKHLDSIDNFILQISRGVDPALSEPISGRIDDALLYLLLLKGMLIERGYK